MRHRNCELWTDPFNLLNSFFNSWIVKLYICFLTRSNTLQYCIHVVFLFHSFLVITVRIFFLNAFTSFPPHALSLFHWLPPPPFLTFVLRSRVPPLFNICTPFPPFSTYVLRLPSAPFLTFVLCLPSAPFLTFVLCLQSAPFLTFVLCLQSAPF